MAPTTDRGRRVARRRLTAVALGLAIVALAVAAVAVHVGTGTSTSTSAPATTLLAPPAKTTPLPRPPYPVGSLDFTVTEPSTGGTPARTFTTYVRYPARAQPPAVTGAKGPTPAVPLRAAGPFPLVVFSGGYAVSPEEYGELLDAWAAAGFVVADPVYPYTSPSPTQALDEGDIVHHPSDLSAVITALLDAGTGSGTGPPATLAGVVDTHRIAAVGHSDGGDVTLASVANTCCHDPRIGAAVILSGAEYTAFGGAYFTGVPDVPLLVVQGTADDVNPPGCSVQLYDQAPGPKYYLAMAGQSHQGPYLQAGSARDTVQQVVVDFLLGTLEGSKPAMAALARDGNVAGSSTLAEGTTTGLHPGPCPGAPTG